MSCTALQARVSRQHERACSIPIPLVRVNFNCRQLRDLAGFCSPGQLRFADELADMMEKAIAPAVEYQVSVELLVRPIRSIETYDLIASLCAIYR